LTGRGAPGDIPGTVRRLLAVLLASTLAAAAHAGEPSCEEREDAAEADVAAAEHGVPADEGCGGCDDGCLECTRCRAPLAVELRTFRPTLPPARAEVGSGRATLEGLRPPSEIFQPPRP
jgi:hypothetical protein